MATAKQIREIVNPLLMRHSDLILTDSDLIRIMPVGHVVRQIYIARSSQKRYFTLSWRLMEMFGPMNTGRSLGNCYDLLGRAERFRPDGGGGGTWVWDDPTMAGDFVEQMEQDVLPFLRSLDTTEAALGFIKSHIRSSGHRGWHWWIIATIALGELDDARAIWPEYGGSHPAPDPDAPLPSWETEEGRWARYGEIGPPLLADDRAALARILHRWEAENVRGTAIEPYWTPTPFPLEEDAEPEQISA
ncbi:hypothetical protein [Methylobacterium oxalidis]|uniref:DUF4375 domain-containing protein n=2 Tax=Methylobacterium oxalidis TaxID=944322 RepID=A0ABQ6DBY3_9HYPH|nr:hypothetical protein [Methylobacterium oxalidis]GJE31386.1 hypothetical protein LDDCCGHA_1563 [Methylobacterium oxalidis]GLS61955.1 hypothetical protein GCM10007888_03360 [Methylobacterium oxalidis]